VYQGYHRVQHLFMEKIRISDSSKVSSNGYTYTGREWDKEIGLYYYRARYYDPMEGRFISKDPIGFRGGINLYGYVGANPINFKDPRGEVGVPTLVVSGVIVATAWLYHTNDTFRAWADYVIGFLVPDGGPNTAGGVVMDPERFASVVSMAVSRYNLQVITNGCDSTIDQAWAQQHPYEAWAQLQFATTENACCGRRW